MPSCLELVVLIEKDITFERKCEVMPAKVDLYT